MNEQMDKETKEHDGMQQPERQQPVPEVKQEAKKQARKPASPKELTPAQLQRRRKMVVMPLFFLIFCGAMWLIFSPSDGDGIQVAGQSGFNVELPIPKEDGIIADKRDAYQQEAQREREREKKRSLQDFSSLFEQQQQSDDGQYVSENPSRPQRDNSNGIASSAHACQDINNQLESWRDEPAGEADDQAWLALEWRIQELERRAEETQAEKTEQDGQVALLEKSYQLAAKYMSAGTGHTEQTEQQSTPQATPTSGTNRKADVQPVAHAPKSVVSLLAAPMEDAAFVEAYARPRNMGFLTAAGGEDVKHRNSIRACVYQTVTLTTGKELQIRLLEPIRAGNIRIPENTVVTGTCRIGGERMEVTINSIQYAGNIIPVELRVYDLDGGAGISVPGNDEVKAVKEVASTLASSAGTGIMISDNAGSQLAADMGKGLIQGASQYVSKKMSVVKVTLKANYGLLLLAKTQ